MEEMEMDGNGFSCVYTHFYFVLGKIINRDVLI
jgi:hypothetical protein